MKRKLSKLDRQSILIFEFLDTPGDEIAPGSNEVGEDFEDERFRHGFLLQIQMLSVQSTEIPERF